MNIRSLNKKHENLFGFLHTLNLVFYVIFYQQSGPTIRIWGPINKTSYDNLMILLRQSANIR